MATPGHTEGCVTYVHSKVPFAKPQRYTSWEELVNFVSVVPPTSVPNFSNHFLRLDGLSLETPSLLEAVAEPTSRQEIDSFLVNTTSLSCSQYVQLLTTIHNNLTGRKRSQPL